MVGLRQDIFIKPIYLVYKIYNISMLHLLDA
jgi:hypothetical protein